MLQYFEGKTGTFEFIQPNSYEPRQNTFTIIVGKNGTGKSRLLRSIASNFIPQLIDPQSLMRDELSTLKNLGHLSLDKTPSRIICISTSPFDRFPLLRRDQYSETYSYLGLRGLSTMNLGTAYISKIIFTLIDAALRNKTQADAIASALEYLGYLNLMSITLQLPSGRFIEELIDAENPARAIENQLRQPRFFPSDPYTPLRQLLELRPEKLSKVVNSAKRIYRSSKAPFKIRLNIGGSGLSFEKNSAADTNDLAILASSGILRLREVTLYKTDYSNPIKLSEASSGEQSVVMSLLGIGSQICDNALICIDEPEICLHPEWQEKYIELLFHTFEHYQGCHFLIATHSPQIIAQIPDGNCFVMSMEDGIARSARNYAHRSIDFQLAEVFRAPGYKNEYLSRIALNIFARVSKAKKFDEKSNSELAILRKIYINLRAEDPLKDLINALEEMAKKYG